MTRRTTQITQLLLALGVTMFIIQSPPHCFGQAMTAKVAPEKQWPQFRGQNAAGISQQAPPAQFGPNKNVRWKIATPIGYSSPIIWGDHLFLTGFDPQAQKLLALAYDARTGKPLWQRVIPSSGIEKTNPVSNPATSTPVTDGERVYFYFGSAGLFAFKFDGTLVWNFPLPVAETAQGSGTSPMITGDLLVLNRDEREKALLIALDRRTGRRSGASSIPATHAAAADRVTRRRWCGKGIWSCIVTTK